MKVFGPSSIPAGETAERRRRSRVPATVMSAALLAAVVATGSATAATTTSPAQTQTARQSVAHATTPIKYYLQQSGTGSKALRAVVLPSKWYLIWKFDCGAKKGTFIFSSTGKGDMSHFVNGAKGQTGLGGGGQLPFKTSGTYHFTTKTTCGWTISAASGLPVVK